MIRILLVEDNVPVAQMMRELLERDFSARVEIARTCAAAREKLSTNDYDIVALDYRLPDGHGHELLERITFTDEHPPVIMVTGHGDEDIAALSIRLGASGYVVKDKNLTLRFSEAVNKALNEIALSEAENDLRAEKAFLEAALDALTDLFCVFDAEGNIIRWNRALSEVTGYSNEEISNMNTRDIFGEGDFQYGRGGFVEIIKGGRKSFEAIARTKDGRKLPYELSGSFLHDDDGNLIGTCIIGRDISERR